MPPLHVLLSALEYAVEKRRECEALNALNLGETKQLVYQLVEHHQRELADPATYLERLVQQTEDRRDTNREATELSIAAREAVLRRMLEILEPSMPSLLGPVPAETWNEPGRHGERVDHPLLRGFELLDGMRKAPGGAGRQIVSGRSWWIVALVPDDEQVRVTARFAALDHVGELDTHREGQGQTWCDVHLVPLAEAAAQIRDDVFDKVLAAALRRLRSVASDGQKEIAARAETAAETLHAAQAAMNGAQEQPQEGAAEPMLTKDPAPPV